MLYPAITLASTLDQNSGPGRTSLLIDQEGLFFQLKVVSKRLRTIQPDCQYNWVPFWTTNYPAFIAEPFQGDPTTAAKATDNRLELETSEDGTRSTPYPSLDQAFKTEADLSSRDRIQIEEQPFGVSSTPYPLLGQAFKEDIGNDSESTEQLSERSNSSYSPIAQAFRDWQNPPVTDNSRSDEIPSDQPYPPVEQSLK